MAYSSLRSIEGPAKKKKRKPKPKPYSSVVAITGAKGQRQVQQQVRRIKAGKPVLPPPKYVRQASPAARAAARRLAPRAGGPVSRRGFVKQYLRDPTEPREIKIDAPTRTPFGRGTTASKSLAGQTAGALVAETEASAKSRKGVGEAIYKEVDKMSTAEKILLGTTVIPGVGAVGKGAQLAAKGVGRIVAKKGVTKAVPKVAKPKPPPTPKPKPKPKPTPKPRVKPKPKVPPKVRRVGTTAAKVAGTTVRIGTLPVRKPLKVGAPLTLGPQVPAAIKTGSLEPFGKALGAQGEALKAVRKVGEVIPDNIAGRVVKEALELPVAVPPAMYMIGAAGVEYALKGDDSRAKAMLEEYKEHGLLPAVFKGDAGAALTAIKEHPLYSALEVSGAYAVAGRGAGAVTRQVPGAKKVVATKREPRKVYGDIKVPRRYSANVFTKGLQVAFERAQRKRGKDPTRATPRQAERYLKTRTDFQVAMEEASRRAHREAVVRVIEPSRVKQLAKQGIPEKAASVVSLVAQRIVRDRKGFREDLDLYLGRLNEAYKSGKLKTSEVKANRALAEHVRAAMRLPNKRVDEIFAAAKRYGKEDTRLQNELVEAGFLAPDQAAKAAAIPYARLHMDAGYKKGVGLVDTQGKPLTLERIRKDMEAQGVEVPAFLTHKPGARGAGSFYQPFQRSRGRLAGAKRTGEAAERGTFDATIEAMSEQLARTQTMADRAAAYDRIGKEFGLRKPDGGYFKNRREAEDALRDPADYGIIPPPVEMVPWRIAPFPVKRAERLAAQKRTKGATLEALDPAAWQFAENLPQKLLERSSQGPGEYVLVPKLVRDRMLEHVPRHGPAAKAFQAGTRVFKSAVLPTSPKWLTGNAVEQGMRSMLSGSGPFDWALGRRLMKRLKRVDPQAAERFEGAALGGMMFGSQKRLNIHRDYRQFEGTNLAPFAKAAETLQRAPGTGNVIKLYKRYRDTVFAFEVGVIEKQPLYAALGKEARRQAQATDGRWRHALMVGDKALTDLAKGLRNTDAQVAYGRAVEQVFGQWHRFEPSFRFMQTSYAPFISWARAASRFVFLTLPGRHPVKTALAAVAARVTEEERIALGLSLFSEKPVEPYMRGSIPLPNGGMLRVQNLSSLGAVSDLPQFYGSQLMPQVMSGVRALTGIDWKEDKLERADGTELPPEERIAPALYIQAEAMMPFLRLARNIRERGPGRPTSTIFEPQVYPDSDERDLGEILKRYAIPVPTSKKAIETQRSMLQQREISIPVKRKPKRKVKSTSGYGSSSSSGYGTGGGTGGY